MSKNLDKTEAVILEGVRDVPPDVQIAGAPVAGTNATITNTYVLCVEMEAFEKEAFEKEWTEKGVPTDPTAMEGRFWLGFGIARLQLAGLSDEKINEFAAACATNNRKYLSKG